MRTICAHDLCACFVRTTAQSTAPSRAAEFAQADPILELLTPGGRLKVPLCDVIGYDALRYMTSRVIRRGTADDRGIPRSGDGAALDGNRLGQFSIRINDQWRVCFTWTDGDAHDVEIVDYH